MLTRRQAEIEFGATAYRIRLARAQVVDAVEALTTEVLRLVQSARPPGALMHLCFSPRIAAIPGLVARLTGLRDCVMVELAPGAAATGALQVRGCHRPPGRRAWRSCIACRLADAAVADDPTQPSAAVPAAAVPTHVLFNGRAWPITSTPLTLGWSVGTGARALTLPAGIAGVSRSHCTLERRDGQAVVCRPQYLRHVRQ